MKEVVFLPPAGENIQAKPIGHSAIHEQSHHQVSRFDHLRMVRTYYVDRDAADRVAERARKTREAAGTLSGHALGELPDEAGAGSSFVDALRVVFATIKSSACGRRTCAGRSPSTGPRAVRRVDARGTGGRAARSASPPARCGGTDETGTGLITQNGQVVGVRCAGSPAFLESRTGWCRVRLKPTGLYMPSLLPRATARIDDAAGQRGRAAPANRSSTTPTHHLRRPELNRSAGA